MLNRLHRWLRRRLPESRFERDLRDELRAHIAHRTDDLIRSGVDPAEARRRAHVEFGSTESFKAEIRIARPVVRLRLFMEAIRHDIGSAARRLRQSPGFTVFAVLTLGAGIGVATATYSGLYSVALRPRGFETDNLLLVNRINGVGSAAPVRLSHADFEALRRQQTSLLSLIGWTSVRVVWSTGAESTFADVEMVTGDFFDTLGVRSVVGRVIQPADAEPGPSPVIVLSDHAWLERFDADPNVPGSIVRINGTPHQVIGVAPPGFRGVTAFAVNSVAGWVPLSPPESTAPLMYAAGRPQPTTTPEAASTEFGLIANRLDLERPLPPLRVQSAVIPQVRGFGVVPADESRTAFASSELARVVLALPALVLLVACSNLTNLFLSRGAVRRQELAVRSALGASRARLIRAEMAEAAMIGIAGGAVGLTVAVAALSWTAITLDEPLRAVDPGLTFQWRVEPVLFAATGAAALLAILVAGLVPAIRLTRPSVSRELAVDGASTTPRWRGRSNLIAIQCGVSVALFLIAVVCVRFLTDPATSRRVGVVGGIDRLVIGLMPFGEQGVPEAEARRTLERVTAVLRGSPLIESVSVASGMPEVRFNGPAGRASGPTGWVRRADDPWLPGETGGGGMVNLVAATPNAFGTAGMSLVSGRLFDESDRGGAGRVVVLSRTLAGDLFESTPAVGQRVLVQLRENALSRDVVVREATVIGVVARPAVSVELDRTRAVWLPYDQQYLPTMGLLVRASQADARPVVGLVADAFREVNPDLALQAVGRVDVIVNGPLVFVRHIATVVTLLGGLALALTMTGLYGVLSQVVSRRQREMGLRIALGADRGRILRLVLLGGFRPVAEGLAIGFGVAWVLRQLMQLEFTSTLAAMDVAMFLLAALPLLAAAAVACYLPARRAARVDPNVALRDL